MDGIEVLIFDVFGTVVDWRTSVVKELQELGSQHKLACTHFWLDCRVRRRLSLILDSPKDWKDFAEEWRAGYMQNTYVFYCIY